MTLITCYKLKFCNFKRLFHSAKLHLKLYSVIQRLLKLENTFSLSKAAIIVGFFALLSRLVGLLRDRLFASAFGAGDTLDVYYAAFRVPDFVFNLLILGTLSVAFIPVFTELLYTDEQKAYKNANTILNFSFLVMGAVSLLLMFAAEPLTKLLVPGFEGEKFQHTVTLTRLFLLSPVIFTLSNVFTSILNAQKKFLIVGLAPILYNCGIIFGLLLLYPRFGLIGLGYGVIIGAILHLVVQIPEAAKNGYRWRPVIDLKDKSLRKIGKLFIPRIFGLDNSQISLIIGSIVGSILASGSIAVYNLANNLQTVPLGVFAISIAVASFPVMSEFYAKKDEPSFVKTLGTSIVKILFFMVPISILILIFRAYIVRLAFGAGNFGWQDTILTFNTLGIFSFSLFAQSLSPLLARAFYARHNTITPVTINLLVMAVNAGLAYYLGKTFGITGVAAAFSVASVLSAGLLFFILRVNLGKAFSDQKSAYLINFDNLISHSLLKIAASSIIMGSVGYGLLYGVEKFVNTHTGLGLLIQAGLAASIAVIVYLMAASYLKLSQADVILAKLKSYVSK
ncbi:MAG: murein biosynthesis integral membrane protein MurJ [Candidatus Doudnabacteria bacterium CG10_big_fil_rev_8_21_14_0_10_42_18]|uniref:Probable lipid II flippase MurJ n=1 Tax=Candidatus Doudnabacteria bacterium CG10_big_fil_rev_8_21_14_0_10_42_18 TaxID=1974552 RepID=A0A2H0VB87_9BACT|nr:MAG: murein biosynthesis integral membrane protein MurJ [Candidatus Doudnabacteria bacterium CG10_big_fil_rev_8_21_14_0_10_42_18]